MQYRNTLASLLLFVCFISGLATAQVYTITDLGSLTPTGINSLGQVVGNYNNQAYIWTLGRMHALGILTGGTFSSAAAINDLGVVVGAADGPGSLISPFPEFPNVDCTDLTQPFIWTPRGGMQPLAEPGNLPATFFFSGVCPDAPSYGRDINDLSQIVGDLPAGPNLYALALLWTRADGMIAFGGTFPPTFGNGINNKAEIVGQNSEPFCDGRATTWQNGVATELGDLGQGAGGYISSANGLNDLGIVVGWSTTTPAPPFNSSPVHAILWSPIAGMSDLGTLPGDQSSAASKVNYFGEVIGSSGNTDYSCANFEAEAPFQVIGRPFIWSVRHGMQPLNALVPANLGWVLNSANDINVWGQIVGQGILNGQPHGFLLTPRNPFQPY